MMMHEDHATGTRFGSFALGDHFEGQWFFNTVGFLCHRGYLWCEFFTCATTRIRHPQAIRVRKQLVTAVTEARRRPRRFLNFISRRRHVSIWRLSRACAIRADDSVSAVPPFLRARSNDLIRRGSGVSPSSPRDREQPRETTLTHKHKYAARFAISFKLWKRIQCRSPRQHIPGYSTRVIAIWRRTRTI